MKTVLLLAAFVGLAAAGSFFEPQQPTKVADKEFIYRQKKVFDLLKFITQVDVDSEYYKISQKYKIDAHFTDYTNQAAVEEFYRLYQHGMMPRGEIFSVFYDQMREEAIALFHLFYYAKDFETFYQTAAWARVHMNEGMYVYALTVAVLHRPDTRGIVLPAPYEIYPYFFVNSEVITKMQKIKMVNGQIDTKLAAYYGVYQENNVYTVYANYSGWYNRYNEEQQLSYFTEDVGLNSYYFYFHADYPFWMGGPQYGLTSDKRGELYYYFHQQLLARYYMERLVNGLGEIPSFSWRWPVKTGFYPTLTYPNSYPFNQRNNYYELQTPENFEDLKFVEDFETHFRQYLELGYYKQSNGQNIDFSQPKSIDAIGNFWQYNPDFFHGQYPKNYNKYYEIIARVLLGASKDPLDQYNVGPSALEQFQTSLRDPMFWQLYKRVMYYFIEFKQNLEPYTKQELYFPDVKVDDVTVEKLVTKFTYYDFDATSAVFWSKEELKTSKPYNFVVRQPRLDHTPFEVKIEISSGKDVEAVVKMYLAPKYDSYGHILSLDDNQYNFVELDSFIYKLSSGKNTIVRNSEHFFRVVDDRTPAYELHKKLDGGDFTLDMSEAHNGFPQRLLLPKGTKGGFPFQFFVIVYPYVAPEKPYGTGYDEVIYSGVGTGARYLDAKPFGYPFDRPIDETYFVQPNMFFEDVFIYHEGDDNVYNYYRPGYDNIVPKH